MLSAHDHASRAVATYLHSLHEQGNESLDLQQDISIVQITKRLGYQGHGSLAYRVPQFIDLRQTLGLLSKAKRGRGNTHIDCRPEMGRSVDSGLLDDDKSSNAFEEAAERRFIICKQFDGRQQKQVFLLPPRRCVIGTEFFALA